MLKKQFVDGDNNMCFRKSVEDHWKKEEWYATLSGEGQCVADLIHKYHRYFSKQDKDYRVIVRVFKITLLTLAMISTIVLGLKTKIEVDTQVVVGLVLSSLITFITAISSYFNFEEYWMRNISIHIRLNIIRDEFTLEAQAKKIDDTRITYYMGELNSIQKSNISYWEKAIKKI